jgi:WD40 repeat protein
MTGLDKRSYQQIIELLTPLMSSEADRRALIVLTFVDHPLIERIDFTGATSAFLPNLIDTLHQFGKLEDGRPALWAVLEVAREQVGLDQKHRIDALRPSFDLPPPPRLDKLFVSYSRRNEIFARKLVGDLKDAGLRVWYDREKIKGSEDWWQSIVNGIKAADYFVFCLSPDAIRSEVARDELLVARQHGKPIFAVMLEDCLDDLKTETFANIQWLSKLHVIDFTQIALYGSKLRELIESLPGYTPPDTYFLDEIDPRDLPNPFRGLEAFLEVDAAYFTGRDDAVADLIERIQDPKKPRLLAVVGASGSGKSSLVRAGLIPAIRQQLPFWDTVTIRPGSSPVDELADRLQERLGVDASGTRNRLRTESQALDDIASELLQGKPEDARFVLVIDQFEEVFTLTSSEEQDIFLQRLLTSILKPSGKLYVILTLRADFFDRLSAVPELAKLVRDNLDIATEMTPDQLRRSIEDPARKVGVIYEEGLVETILEDVRAQPGSLPLLQYALKELFERKVGRRMTYEAYEQIGGVKGALASRAENLFSEMSANQQEALRKILLRLVEVGDETITRRRTAISDLHFIGVADRTVETTLDQLTGPETRLLVASTPLVQDETSSEDEIYYEVSHEALLTHWNRVANWIDDNREDLRRSSEILALAKSWDDTNRTDNSFLLRGARLANAREWLQRSDPTALQREFVEASITFDEAEKERELALQRRALNRARLLAGGFAVFLLVAIGLTLFAFDQQGQAVNSAATSDANVTIAVAAQGTSASNALTSVAAVATATVAQGEALDQASTASAAEAIAVRRAEEAQSVALAAGAENALDNNQNDLAVALAVEAYTIDAPPILADLALVNSAAYTSVQNRLAGHDGPVWTVDVSSDGDMALSGGADNRIILWDLETGEILRTFDEHTGEVTDVSFSYDGARFVSGANDNAVLVWDLNSGEVVQRFEGDSSVDSVAIHPNGLFVAAGFSDLTVQVWNTETPQEPQFVLTGHQPSVSMQFGGFVEQPGNVWGLEFTNDGTTLLSGASDGNIITWDVETGEEISRIENSDGGRIRSLALSPSGNTLASGHGNGSVFVWDTASGDLIMSWSAHQGSVTSIAFHSSGEIIATGSQDLTIATWDLVNRRGIAQYTGHTSTVRAVRFLPSGQFILSGSADGTLISWDLGSSSIVEQFWGHENAVWSVDFNSDGSRVVSTGEGTKILVWETSTGEVVTEVDAYITESAISNGWRVARFTPDDRYIFSGIGQNTIGGHLLKWDAITGDFVDVFQGHTDRVFAIDVSNDGRYVISGSLDTSAIIWDVETGEIIHRLNDHSITVTGVAFSPDDELVATASVDSKVIIWNVETGEIVHELIGHTAGALSVEFSPDGSQLVSSGDDNLVILWDVDTGIAIRRFEGHIDAVWSVSITPDGSHLVTASSDNSLILWDLNSGRPLRRFVGHQALVTSTTVDPTGTVALSASGDRTLILWQLEPYPDGLYEWVIRNRYRPDFTCEQRQTYQIEPLCSQ